MSIKLEDLKQGYLYKISARNAEFGIWLEEKESFLISRFKFRDNFLFIEEFFRDDPPSGTALPIEEIEKVPYNLDPGFNEEEILAYLNSKRIDS